jgi:hypothetical protein
MRQKVLTPEQKKVATKRIYDGDAYAQVAKCYNMGTDVLKANIADSMKQYKVSEYHKRLTTNKMFGL